jgi:hypothetical protein
VSGEPPPEASRPPPGDPAPSVPDLPEPPDLPPVPDDASDTRSWHFRRLLGNVVVLGVTAILAAIVLVAVGTQAGFGLGVAAAAGLVLVALLVVWVLASSRAADDFFTAYAQRRDLTRLDGRSNLPPITPLLQKGDRRYAEQRFNGVLPGGIDGSLCLYTYEDESTDSDGDKQTTYVHFTIVMTQLPATAPLIRELFCQRRLGFRFMDSMEDVFRRRQRVEHESAAVDKEFEIFIGEGDDMNRARQILSPTFLVWLEANSAEEFAFELVAGSLVANVKGHKKSAAELDLLCQASAAVARRLQDEALELSTPAQA